MNLQKLNTSNYDSWSEQIEAILNQKKCWLDLDGADAAKADYAATAKKAYFEIVVRCDSQHTQFIKSVAKYDSVKALNALRDKYEGKGLISRIGILQKCLLMRHQQGTIEKHIDDLRTNYQLLKKKGLTIETMQVANLMITLPSDFGSVLANFINVDEKELNFEDVASAILVEQNRRSIIEGYDVNASAASFNRFDRKKLLKCTRCGKKGHLTESCAQQSSVTHQPNISCTFCGKKNHQASRCFKKLNENNRQNQTQSSHFTSINNEDNKNNETSMYANPYHKAFVASSASINSSLQNKRRSVFNRLSSVIEDEDVMKNFSKITMNGDNTMINQTSKRQREVNESSDETEAPPTPGKNLIFDKNTNKYRTISTIENDPEIEIHCNEKPTKLTQLREAGIMDHIKKPYYELYKEKPNNDPKILTMDDLSAGFVVFLVFLLISIASFLLEIIIAKLIFLLRNEKN
ncbi:CLUMA_CG005438, isoform A [Clunio marinus]|uniref:CLUMA_CG005438, isoform A n=1 Tax=Clunio marinus TaxID=568069 RepID=A0A1J1HUY6_9DIPT|nr:CLUMA_CG005438, isoform A [Clunio marinus]